MLQKRTRQKFGRFFSFRKMIIMVVWLQKLSCAHTTWFRNHFSLRYRQALKRRGPESLVYEKTIFSNYDYIILPHQQIIVYTNTCTPNFITRVITRVSLICKTYIQPASMPLQGTLHRSRNRYSQTWEKQARQG